MTSLSIALESMRPEIHNALRRAARKAYPLEESEAAYPLMTVAGSAASWQPVGDSVWQTVAPLPEEDKRETMPYNLPLWGSKLGGYGLLPRGTAYPVGSEGQPLQLVVQLNFGELWAAAAAGDDRFEVPTEYPSRGVLAFYADPFDDNYGVNYHNFTEQKGFKVLFFDEEIQPVEALLEAYKGGAMDATALESKTEELLWTREEQYELFINRLQTVDYPYFPYNSPFLYTSLFNREEKTGKNPEWIKFLNSGLRTEPAPGEVEKGWDKIYTYRARRPCLWYGVADLHQEFRVTVRGAEEMVPVEAVEFNNHCLVDCLTEHPALVDEYFKNEDCYVRSLDELCSPLAFQFFIPSDNEENPTYSGVDRDINRPRWLRNYLGGYPVFAQEDVRPRITLSDVFDTVEEGEGEAKRTVVKRKEGSDAVLAALYESEDPVFLELNENSHRIEWKDVGVCGLFIKKADLEARLWTKLWYTWDCV